MGDFMSRVRPNEYTTHVRRRGTHPFKLSSRLMTAVQATQYGLQEDDDVDEFVAKGPPN
jgi:hypothetical protein